MEIKFSFIIFCGTLILVYSSSSVVRKSAIEPIDDYNEEIYERMEQLRQGAIEKYGLPHEIDYDFDPENFGGVFLDYSESYEPISSVKIARALQTRAIKEKTINLWNIPHFQPLCETHRRAVYLSDIYHDYRPSHYEEIHCVHPYVKGANHIPMINVCNRGSFHCIQMNRTIHLTRRAKGAECWELEQRVIPAGCECMWPKHLKGDVQDVD